MSDRPLLRVVETGPPEAVSMHELRERLADFQDAHGRCVYLDSWAAVVKCRDLNQRYIDRLQAEIERRESEDDERQAPPAPLWPAGQGDEGD